MRISDWSSDVCSSDLPDRTEGGDADAAKAGRSRPAFKHRHDRRERFRRHGGSDRSLIADVIRSRGERANALGAAQLDAGEKARFATVCCGTIHQRHPFARSVWLVAGSEPPRKAEASAAAANIVPGPASDRIWGDFTRDSVLIIFFSLPIISCLIHAGVEPKDGGRSAFAVPNCDGSAPISKTSSPPPIRSACAIQFLLHG